MSELFRNVLNASFQGSIVIAVVLLARLALKKAPKKYICLLWILVGVRLLCSVMPESPLSLQPDVPQIVQVFTEPQPQPEIPEQGMVPAVPEDAELPEDVEIVYGDAFADHVVGSPEPEQHLIIDWLSVCAWIWLAAAGMLAAYSLISYLLLKRRVREAVHLFENVWECSGLDTAFLLGFRNTKILLPAGLNMDSQRFILNHERVHLERGDHWVKLIGFAAVTVHWFNPLVWLAYTFLCRDMEMACDERVIRDMGLEERKKYSAALLECSANRTHWAACPVAFGEVSVKQRIMSVLRYRKPAFWLSAVGILAVIVVAVCFLTDPAGEARIPGTNGDWEAEIRAVLEEIQSRDAYAIIEQRQFEGEKSLNDSADLNFFRYGDDWLTIVHIDDLAENGWTGHLYLDGQYYEAIASDAVFDWQPAEQTDYPEPWLYSFDMDAVDASAISRKGTSEGYELRLLVQGPYIGLGESYFVDFSFDHDGNFRNAVLHASGMEELMDEMVETNITTIMYIHDNAGVDIPGTIEQYAWDLVHDVETIWGSDSAEEIQPDWGLTLTATDVSPSGLTLVCERKGGEWPGYVMTGRRWWLEKWTGQRWEIVEPVQDLAWAMDAQLIGMDTTARWDCSFVMGYGALEPGTYRIGKDFSNVAEYKVGIPQSAEEITCDYYAEFVIEETDPLTRCETALKAFQAQESYCLKTQWDVHDTSAAQTEMTTQLFYKAGKDWMRESLFNTAGLYHLEKDGIQYQRVVANVPESEGDTGWVRMKLENEEDYLPWLSTFRWDRERIEYVQSHWPERDVVTFTVSEPENAEEMSVTFEFVPGTNTLKTVYLNDVSNGEDYEVAVVMTPQTGSDAAAEIERVYVREIDNA